MPVAAISSPKIALTSVLLPTPVLPKMARLNRPISSALSFQAFPKAWPNHSSVGFAMASASQSRPSRAHDSGRSVVHLVRDPPLTVDLDQHEGVGERVGAVAQR